MSDPFAQFRERCGRFAGIAGVTVLDESGAVLLAAHEREPFPAASVIKLPLVLTLCADAAEGALSIDERVPVGPSLDGSRVLRMLRHLETMSLRDLAMLAITVSDKSGWIERVRNDAGVIWGARPIVAVGFLRGGRCP